MLICLKKIHYKLLKLISILTILDPDCYERVYKTRSLTPQPIPPTTTKTIGTKKNWWVFANYFTCYRL